jgi:hypothetical protein
MKVWRCSNAATRAVEAEVSSAKAVGKVVGIKVVRKMMVSPWHFRAAIRVRIVSKL